MFFLNKKFALNVLLVALLICAGFLRLWRLPLTLMFQGDQGRDALIVSRIFTHHDLVFIGPVTSVGNMYLGPLYYYFMLPFLWLTYPSPVGPAYAVALLGILTVYLLYRWGTQLVGQRAAIFATFLYTFSASVIFLSRFSWNPNPAPFVSLVMIYATYKAWRQNPWYWIVVAICFSILIQLHYLALLSVGGAGLIWLWQLKDLMWGAPPQASPPQATVRQFLVATVIGTVIFGLSLTPLILFDYKHEWLNVKAFQKLVTQEEAFVEKDSPSLIAKVPKTIKETHGRAMHIFFEHTLGKNREMNTALVAIVAVGVLWLMIRHHRPTWHGEMVILAYLITGIVGTALYEHTIFDHYIAYLFPVSFLVLGMVLNVLTHKKIGWLPVVSFIGLFLAWNLPRLPLKPGTWTLFDMQHVSQSVYEHVRPGEKYGLVLLSESRDSYGQNYRYFLATTDRPPLPPELVPQAETLVIINEEKLTNVANLPIYEIVTFPHKDQPEVYTFPNGPEIIIYRK